MTTILGIALVFFPAQQITIVVVLRNLDVWRHPVLHRTGRILLLRLRSRNKQVAAGVTPVQPSELGDNREVCMAGGVKTDVSNYQMYVNGKWVDSKSKKTFPVYDPASAKK